MVPKIYFDTNLVLLRPITKYTQAPSTVTDHWTSAKENKVTVSVNRPKLFSTFMTKIFLEKDKKKKKLQ